MSTDTRKLIEECRAALAEELAAWTIEPPLHHVKQAHDHCVKWLADHPAVDGQETSRAESSPAPCHAPSTRLADGR